MSVNRPEHHNPLHDDATHPDPGGELHVDERWHQALANLERESAAHVPSASQMLDRVQSSPAPLDVPTWSLSRGVRLVWLAARMQVKFMMWMILVAAMIVMGASVLMARFLVVGGYAQELGGIFAGVLLAGTAIYMAFAFADTSDRELMLSAPLGPSTQVAVRMTVVLALDLAVNVLATWLAVTLGYGQSMGVLIAGWLTPLLLVSGVCALISLWCNPWIGLISGLLVTYAVVVKSMHRAWFLPDVIPMPGDMASASLVGSAVLVIAGLVSVLLAVGGARRAYTARLNI